MKRTEDDKLLKIIFGVRGVPVPLKALLTRCVFHLGQVLDLLQLLELLVIPNVRVVGRQTRQIVDETEDDEQTGDTGQDEHHFGRLHAILAEGLHLDLVLDL